MVATVPEQSALFANEHSVLSALVAVRNAAIPAEEKAAIRDLFLDYVSSEGESGEQLRQAIIKKLQAVEGLPPELLQLLPENTFEKPEVAEQAMDSTNSRLGYSRPVLSFTPASVDEPSVDSQPAPAPSPEPSVASSATEHTTPTPEAPKPQVAVAESTNETAAPVAQSQPQTSNPKVRIDEIKHEINTAVGNPVNLITMDEAVGREYMAALLEAMKKVAAGGVATSELARLETAYGAAKQVIAKSGDANTSALSAVKDETPPADTVPTASVSPNPTPAPPPEPEPIPEPAPAPVAEPALEPLSAAPDMGGGFAAAHKSEAESVTKKDAENNVVESNTTQPATSTGLYHRPEDDVAKSGSGEKVKEVEVDTTTPELGNEEDTEAKRSALAKLATGLWSKKTGEKADAVKEEPKPSAAPLTTPLGQPQVRKVGVNSAAVPAQTPAAKQPATEMPLKPISTATSLPEKISEMEKKAALNEAAKQKPVTDLNSPEVTAGLEQLLSEWKLFKKSGLLGTGPSGMNHPLYKEIADQPMAIVVAGRFEGATPEVKRSLTSYMNGWRYEQGIVHELGETFENYLRRVILHILQNQRRKA